MSDGLDRRWLVAVRRAAPAFQTFRSTQHLALRLIDRPDRRNALTCDMWAALPVGAVVTGRRASADRDRCRLARSRPAPTSVSCSRSTVRPDAAAAYHATNVAAEEALAAFPAPTIAAVRGSCVGGGCQLAAACDLRVAADRRAIRRHTREAWRCLPRHSDGAPGHLVGSARAKYLLFTADLIDAATARTFGLVDEVVPAAALVDRATALATTIALAVPADHRRRLRGAPGPSRRNLGG